MILRGARSVASSTAASQLSSAAETIRPQLETKQSMSGTCASWGRHGCDTDTCSVCHLLLAPTVSIPVGHHTVPKGGGAVQCSRPARENVIALFGCRVAVIGAVVGCCTVELRLLLLAVPGAPSRQL